MGTLNGESRRIGGAALGTLNRLKSGRRFDVAGDSKAKVIPLHSNTGRQAAQRRAAARGEGARRHPSLLTDPSGRASAEQIAAVVREIDERRSAASGTPPADESPNELAQRIAGVAEFVRKRMTGDYTV